MNPARILVVEDESIVALDIRDRLTAMGYEIADVTDRGEDALVRVETCRPDLVLMDIRLKGAMDGISAAEAIRQRWRLPVVYLTAFSEDHTLQRAKVTEPFGYIIKPFEDREIQSVIEMALYKHQAEQRLRESERRYATTLTSIGDGVIATDPAGRVTFMNPVAERLTGWPLAEAQAHPLPEVFTIANEQTRQAVEDPVGRVLREGKVVGLANHTLLISRDGREIPIDDCAAPILDDRGTLTGTVLVFQDVSERRQKEAELKRIEWMLSPRPRPQGDTGADWQQAYGDLTALNTSRLILDSVGPDLLRNIVSDYMDLLETSSAVYEKNGDYAFGMFASGWCRFMDHAARKCCGTPDNREALACGRWHCHESCWAEAANPSIAGGGPVDIACRGGIRLYAVPIRAGDEIVGSINFGYGDPPRDPSRLRELAEAYGVRWEDLRPWAAAYQTRPQFIIDLAKRRIEGSARLIGEIVERKRAEKELRRSHQTFLTVLDGIEATIYVADMDTYEILFTNKHMIEAFGADLTGRPCYEAFRRESEPCGHCTNDQLLDADGKPAGVCVWETKNPITGRWYINYDRAIRWVDGRTVRLQIATDISKLKELEQERVRVEEQLRQAQKMESVGRLAGGVAHDFNNMLSAILGHAELAMMQLAPSEEILDDLKAIKKAAQRSADLTRQLLAFARKQTIAPKVLDLNATVASMLKMLKRLIGEDIDLAWRPGADLWPVRIDPSQIDQLLANLCVNARDAIAGVGKATIETENTAFDKVYCAVHPEVDCGDYVMIAVSDNGCGMTKEVIDQLFEPFFTTKEVGKGTGLGLATVYGIVKQNGGFINVYSEPGQGTTFKIYLPRFAGDVMEPVAESTSEAPKGRGETVLLVEDEASILKVGRVMLERLGYAVVAAATPGEALRQAQAHAADIRLLVTDVIMPEMNGRDLAQRISDITPGLKCLFTSGYTANVIAHHGVLDEGVQFLQKPFSLKELALKVRQALEDE